MERIFLTVGLSIILSSHLPAVWRSTLYPEDWEPGFSNDGGLSLLDFSYAGYHRGETPLPRRNGPIFNVTCSPYDADSSGQRDSTGSIQAALDAAALAGGGIVFLPSGTYRISPPEGKSAALRIEGDNTILRGAGAEKTFLCNETPFMRGKTIISVKAHDAAWWYADGSGIEAAKATDDFSSGSRILTVEHPEIFQPGDQVVVRNDLTEAFIFDLGMAGKWTPENMKNRSLVFQRRIVSTDRFSGTVTIDSPIRYALKRSDCARVIRLPGKLISEVGLEDFSLGAQQHPGTSWGEEDFNVEGTAAYDVHQSHAIVFESAENCWMRRVDSYRPGYNAGNFHTLSNGVKLERSRQVTLEDCHWGFPQYRGGGGNGYLFTLHGNDCLIRKCVATSGRHNFDFGTMSSSGNVLLYCIARDGRLASDFHMYFSVSNLIDNLTCDGDFVEAKYRPWGSPVHGVTTGESVFWNTHGLRYCASPFEFEGKMHTRLQVLIQSEQFGNGYVIGTRGPAFKVQTTDFVEGVGEGESLAPSSLYEDQLKRRLGKSTTAIRKDP